MREGIDGGDMLSSFEVAERLLPSPRQVHLAGSSGCCEVELDAQQRYDLHVIDDPASVFSVPDQVSNPVNADAG